MKGIEYASEYRLKINQEPKKKWYEIVLDSLNWLLEYLTPLKDEVKIIKATQTQGVYSFFNFMRRLLIFSYLQIFCFAPFILINFIN